MKKIKIFFAAIGAVVMLDGIFSGLSVNFNVGIIAQLLAGAVCVLLGVLWDKLKNWIRAVVIGAMTVVLCCCLTLWGCGVSDSADYSEDVLIVLGAGVHGTTPSLALVNRLDAAAEYLNKNADAYVIVTGGQGPQEDVTEAYAMEKYLIEHGIARERIIKEEEATSTSENYRYSKRIIEERFPSAKIATVTNDFHMYRAVRLAKIEGIDTASYHAKTPVRGIAAMYLRELMAIVKLWVFKN